MLCELCGKEVDATSRVRIEGSVLSVCADCARFGEAIDPPRPPADASAVAYPVARRVAAGARAAPAPRRLEERDLYQEIGELELAPDWGRRVRVAREAAGWTPEELGKRLNEKKSVVLKVESGGFRPPDALIRKLEHLLKVRLRADPESAARS